MIMKKIVLYTALLAIPIVYSCNQNTETKNAKADAEAKMDSLATKACFVAKDEGDNADLQLRLLSNGKVKGNLVITYAEKANNDGQIEGEFKGDTLFVDYTFKAGESDPAVYKNPLAFLKQGDKMILGVGQIETSMGRSYFVKEKPIRFDQSKFIFTSVACAGEEPAP
jgi:hypothetical protein